VGKGGMVQGKCRSEKRWASDPSDEGQKKNRQTGRLKNALGKRQGEQNAN